ncbi:unnamed protein product [Rotaria sp. Silwood2]|nr:unnamed protein product [Rotaria sp. Silwood2]CAF3245303.1 unnamed protein product [Rotaria sp. Silwood2]CAF4209001.1 unnamed protein product [Rotaria sp. Silwood2]
MAPHISCNKQFNIVENEYYQPPQELMNLPLVVNGIAAPFGPEVVVMHLFDAEEFNDGLDPVDFDGAVHHIDGSGVHDIDDDVGGSIDGDVFSVVHADHVNKVFTDEKDTSNLPVTTSLLYPARCLSPLSSRVKSILAGMVMILVVFSLYNIDLYGTPHDNAAAVVKKFGDTTAVYVFYKYDDFIRFKTIMDERRNKMTGEIAGGTGSLKKSTKRQCFVRTKFNYDPFKDSNIPGDRDVPYYGGDILYIGNVDNDSWWCTNVNIVQEATNTSKHCILHVSDHAIKCLITTDLYPIAIFIKPCDAKWIINNIGNEANEECVQQMYEKSLRIEQQFGHVVTDIVEEETLTNVYDRICDVIDLNFFCFVFY